MVVRGFAGSPFFFFNDTATTEIYTLSLHDALPIWSFSRKPFGTVNGCSIVKSGELVMRVHPGDRKSTRLNSSHSQISYAVFCLKKKKKQVDVSADQADLARNQNAHECPTLDDVAGV